MNNVLQYVNDNYTHIKNIMLIYTPPKYLEDEIFNIFIDSIINITPEREKTMLILINNKKVDINKNKPIDKYISQTFKNIITSSNSKLNYKPKNNRSIIYEDLDYSKLSPIEETNNYDPNGYCLGDIYKILDLIDDQDKLEKNYIWYLKQIFIEKYIHNITIEKMVRIHNYDRSRLVSELKVIKLYIREIGNNTTIMNMILDNEYNLNIIQSELNMIKLYIHNILKKKVKKDE